jgi:hypothetical protein
MRPVLLLKVFLLTLSLSTTTIASSFTDYPAVLRATWSILAQRCFISDDHAYMSFGPLQTMGPSHSQITLKFTYPDGRYLYHLEVIKNRREGVFSDHFVNGQFTGRFWATVEDPFYVLRLRPLTPSQSKLISRECWFNKREGRTACYFKMRDQHDVYVAEFKEIACM